MLGPCVQIYSSDHIYKTGSGPYRDRGESASAVFIGENVWIGANAIILRGTDLGDDCVLSASSIAKGYYESGTLIHSEKIVARASRIIRK